VEKDENSSSSATSKKLTSVERILERAIEVIDAEGEAAIRTNEIAHECGVTAPILYRAYGSREGLIIAAQSERFRRSLRTAADFIMESVVKSQTRDQLHSNMGNIFDMIFLPDRIPHRRTRLQVLGSAITRPELQKMLQNVYREYALTIAEKFEHAIQSGWIKPREPMVDVTMWCIAITDTRLMMEFNCDPNSETLKSWNAHTKRASLDAIFGSAEQPI
jgi:AcrR family transcriptional regulator